MSGRKRPVSLEVCGTVSEWKRDHFDLNYILDQALRWHVTSVNLKSSPIPEDWKPQFDTFQKKIGYRFLLRTVGVSQERRWRFDDGRPHVVAECRSAPALHQLSAGSAAAFGE